MGNECSVITRLVDDIPRTESGKYLSTVSHIWNRSPQRPNPEGFASYRAPSSAHGAS